MNTNIDAYLDHLNLIDAREAMFREAMPDCTMREYRLLALVSRDQSARLNRLSAARSITQQNVGRMCSTLSSRGLIRVITDQRDKRAKNVRLTSAGDTLRHECDAVLNNLLTKEQ